MRFNTNDKRHFPKYMLTRVPNFTTYIWNLFNSPFFNLSMFTEEDGTTINKRVRKEFK